MTVAELIAELSKIEDQTLDVLRADESSVGGVTEVYLVDVVGKDVDPAGPYVRLW